MSKKYVYLFSEGNANMRELLGGKGANLAEMTNIGLPVPQGFTITTEACTQYYEDGRKISPEIQAEIMEYITKMEGITGKKFGDLENPLLVSVRSGARASMPGMMDTILNLGLNEDVVEVMAKKSGNPRWAWDCYRRFIQMYSDVVMEVGKKYFEQLIDQMKEARGVTQDVELTAEDLKELAGQFKAEYKSKIGTDFPTISTILRSTPSLLPPTQTLQSSRKDVHDPAHAPIKRGDSASTPNRLRPCPTPRPSRPNNTDADTDNPSRAPACSCTESTRDWIGENAPISRRLAHPREDTRLRASPRCSSASSQAAEI